MVGSVTCALSTLMAGEYQHPAPLGGEGWQLCLDPQVLAFVLPSMADFNLYLLGVIKYNLSVKAFGEFCESF